MAIAYQYWCGILTRLPKTFLGFTAAILLLFFLMFFAPFTDTGSRFVIALANSFSALEIEYESGSLLSRIKLKKIKFESDSFELKLNQVSASMETSCLWRSTICFPDLQADQVAIKWAGGQWTNGALRTRVSMSKMQILVQQLELQDADLLLERATQKDTLTSNMPNMELPFALIVKKLIIRGAHWRAGEAEAQHQLITLKGKWIDSLLTLDEVTISSEDVGVLGLSGKLQFREKWPFELEAKADWDDAFFPAHFIDLPGDIDKAQLQTPWLLSASGTAETQNFSIRGAVGGLGYDALELIAEGNHGVQQSDSHESQILISRFELLHKASSSALNADAKITLGTQGHTRFSINTGGFTIPRLSSGIVGRLSGAVKGQVSYSQATWALLIEKIDLAGDVNDLPAQIQGNLEIDKKLRILNSQLSADLNGAHLTLSATEKDNGHAKLNLTVEDISQWLPGTSGRLESSGVLTSRLGDLELIGQVQNFRRQAITFQSAEVNTKIKLGKDFPFTASVIASRVAFDSVVLDSLQLDVAGNKAEQSASLRSIGGLDGVIQVSGRATAEGWQGELDSTSLNTPVGVWQLEHSVVLDWVESSNQLSLDSHCWQTTDAKICPGKLILALNDDGSSMTGGADFTGDISTLATFMPDGYVIHSQLTLATQIQWSSGAGLALSGELALQAGELSKILTDEEFANFNWDAASMRFSYDKDVVRMAATLSQNGADVVAVDVELPGLKTAPVSGDLSFTQFQLQSIQPFLSSFRSLDGYVNGHVELSGTAGHPEGLGRLSVSDAAFTLTTMPATFQSLQLELDFLGDSAKILGGVSVGDGQMDITGNVQYKPQVLAVLHLVGRGESLIFPPSVQAKVSHDLTLTASPDFLGIKGELRVLGGEFKLESLPENGVSFSDDVVEIDYMGREITRSTVFDIAMDVQVDIDDKFKITGGLADITVGGDLHLLQERGQPLQLFGNLNVLGGELRVYRQSLKVKRGTVSFAGSPDNPSLDMRAARVISRDSVTVGMELTGTVESPVLEIYSEPAMSQTEALSYLVRGRGLDTGAAADGAGLALSMGTSMLNQTGVFNTLDKLPGINSVELSAEGSKNDTTATISGYIGQRIYLSYGVGLYEPINVLTARLYLKTRLWLEVVSSLENSLDLYYSFDIE